ALSSDRERPERPHLEEAAHQPVRRLADQDGPRLRERLEASRQVGGVADRRVVHLEVVADGPDDDRTGVDQDAGPTRDAFPPADARSCTYPAWRVSYGLGRWRGSYRAA